MNGVIAFTDFSEVKHSYIPGTNPISCSLERTTPLCNKGVSVAFLETSSLEKLAYRGRSMFIGT